MATVAAVAMRRAVAGLALGLMVTGCVGLPVHPFGPPLDPPRVAQVVVNWRNSVAFSPDPVNGGRQQPVLGGQMYLFGATVDYPMVARGGAKVELFDESNGPATGPALEEWVFRPEDMPHLMKKDFLGVCYMVLLPWGTYRPEIQKIKLRTAYLSPDGLPVYTENVVTLDTNNGVITDVTGKVSPAGLKR